MVTAGVVDVGEFPSAPYPGSIPDYPFVQLGRQVIPLCLEDPRRLSTGASLASLVRDATDDDFGAVVAYGSNACPSRIAEKFGVIAPPTIVLPGVLTGAHAAWCRARSRGTGHRAWTLVGTRSGSMSCQVLLVATSNLKRLDESEGRSAARYELVRLSGLTCHANGFGAWQDPVTYLGLGPRGPLLSNHRPVTVADRPTEPSDPDVLDPDAWDDGHVPRHEVIPSGVSLVDIGVPRVLAILLDPRPKELGAAREKLPRE